MNNIKDEQIFLHHYDNITVKKLLANELHWFAFAQSVIWNYCNYA